MAAIIQPNCTRCGACLEECPSHAIIASSPVYVIDPDLCDEHLRCISVCPEGAILLPKGEKR